MKFLRIRHPSIKSSFFSQQAYKNVQLFLENYNSKITEISQFFRNFRKSGMPKEL